ncbi:MAG TPA: glutamate--tRNA ligase [Patescibacteria group bacterium]|nr:glutamate--tRNA ligase [Patescibacteria group bacterium]
MTNTFDKKENIRVRMAPSPTGVLHVGTARTALFNYLFAKHTGGTFILRIEDTDRSRSTIDSEKEIIAGLKWLGISWDEGPDIGGPFGPYRQMERLDIYQRYTVKLLEKGRAYPCFCTEEELQKEREEQMKKGIAPRYSGKCKTIDSDQAKMFTRDGRSHVVRFAMPSKKVLFHDLIRGDVEFDSALFGDFVMIKSDGIPLFILSNVIDDIEMKISHVIRGEDHISNTPKQVLLYEALGAAVPQFAHLPILLGTDRSKLSKRHGTTSIDDYQKQGFLPHAIINFIALLGWNPGTDQEIFTLDELVKQFTIERVQKSGAIFNIEKLEWLNGQYIRAMSPDAFVEACLPLLKEAGVLPSKPDEAMLKKILILEQSRVKTLSEISQFVDFYFKEPVIDPTMLIPKKGDKDTTRATMTKSVGFLEGLDDEAFHAEKLKEAWYAFCEKEGLKPIQVLWPLRVALTGKQTSPGVFEIMEILGKKEILKRLQTALIALA